MNRTELCARIAARSSSSRADAVTAVDAVVSAIADALERGETVNIAGFGKFATSHRAARQGLNPRTGEAVAIPARTVPTFKAGKPFATGSTGSMASAALRWPPPVPEPLPGRLPSFAIRVQRRARCDMRPLRRSLRPDHHGGGLPRHPPSSDFPSARGHSTHASYRPLPEAVTFVAGTRRENLCDWSIMRANEQSCAPLESPRARVPYIAGCEFSPATTTRPLRYSRINTVP